MILSSETEKAQTVLCLPSKMALIDNSRELNIVPPGHLWGTGKWREALKKIRMPLRERHS